VPTNDFLQELKDAFNSVMQAKEHIDARASTLITLSGTVATLLFVFGSYLLSNIVSDYYLRDYMFYILALGIFAALFSLLYSLLVAYRRATYQFAMTHGVFFKNGVLDKDIVEKFKNASEKQFSDLMVNEYLTAIKENTERNASKALKLQVSQWSLFGSILLIMVLVILLGMALYDNKILNQPVMLN
jgi:hypothetical protein